MKLYSYRLVGDEMKCSESYVTRAVVDMGVLGMKVKMYEKFVSCITVRYLGEFFGNFSFLYKLSDEQLNKLKDELMK